MVVVVVGTSGSSGVGGVDVGGSSSNSGVY